MLTSNALNRVHLSFAWGGSTLLTHPSLGPMVAKKIEAFLMRAGNTFTQVDIPIPQSPCTGRFPLMCFHFASLNDIHHLQEITCPSAHKICEVSLEHLQFIRVIFALLETGQELETEFDITLPRPLIPSRCRDYRLIMSSDPRDLIAAHLYKEPTELILWK